jgi:uncharacterized ParB-like nuclease family protein
MAQTIAIEKIKTDGGTQARAALNEDVVAEYAEAIIAGANMPPVTVFHDGKAYWLADGFHRFHAHRKARAIEIAADVIAGTKRDAILYSVGANSDHGLRRSNADKRAAVQTLLADKEWKTWSDRQIAEACGVSVPFVGAIRRPEVAAKQKENRASNTITKPSSTGVIGLHPTASDAPLDQAQSQSHDTGDSANRTTAATTVVEKPEVEPANDDGPDLAELVDELQAENTRLTAMIQAAEADDLKAEAIKWRAAYERSLAAQSEAMDSAHASQKREKFSMTQLRRCGKAVGVDDPRHIAAAVEAMAKAKAAA